MIRWKMGGYQRRETKYFRFKAMWLRYKNCESTLKRGWDMGVAYKG